jgi:hypothetical protein
MQYALVHMQHDLEQNSMTAMSGMPASVAATMLHV